MFLSFITALFLIPHKLYINDMYSYHTHLIDRKMFLKFKSAALKIQQSFSLLLEMTQD
jgi:hypothetical protein